MRVTQVLWKQHLGRMNKTQWWSRSRPTVLTSPAESILLGRGVEIVDAKEVAPPAKLNLPRVEPLFIFPRPPPRDETHPDWNERPRLAYLDNNVLLDGTAQAQVLLNTERVNTLPERLDVLREEPDPSIDKLIKRFIYSSHIFDAHQEKLPKKKDPLRPAYNFARIYGIPDVRKMRNFVQKVLQICELSSDPMIGKQRKIIEDAKLCTYIERDRDLLYFESSADVMTTSSKLLTPLSQKCGNFSTPLPNIQPLDPTVSLKPEHIYSVQDYYPIAPDSQWINPHTIFLSYDSQFVKNITELPVSEDQIMSRSLMKSFATAACCAKMKYGEDVIDLPEPIIVQCVQSNGKWFDFSAFQLNTLDVTSTRDVRNVWWCTSRLVLYEKAEYIDGRPRVDGYNPDVLRKLLAFYRNA